MQSITELKNRCPGRDFFILGSDKSLDYIPKDFFQDRLCIAINRIYRWIPCTYTVCCNETETKDILRDRPPNWVGSEHYGAHHTQEKNPYPDFVFQHEDKAYGDVDKFQAQLDRVVGTDKLMVGFSTSTCAIHLAAYMGARTIFLCGQSGVKIDGQVNLDGYHTEEFPQGGYHAQHNRNENVLLKKALEAHYGCHIVNLLPFVVLDLERFGEIEEGD